MARRLLLCLALAILTTTGVAHAQYVPGISPGSPVIVPGSTATVSACCFAPQTPVTFSVTAAGPSVTLTGLDGLTVIADNDGLANATVQVPSDLPAGTNITVQATGVDASGSSVTVSRALPVVAAETPTPTTPTTEAVAAETLSPEEETGPTALATGFLPVTGSHSTVLFISSLALMAAGLAMLATRHLHESRRRPDEV